MADQMTPAELRAAADEMDEWVNPNNAFDICMDAARRLADVLDLADDVTSYRAGRVGTHYEDCYRNHAGCLAARIRATARGESTSHEDRRER